MSGAALTSLADLTGLVGVVDLVHLLGPSGVGAVGSAGGPAVRAVAADWAGGPRDVVLAQARSLGEVLTNFRNVILVLLGSIATLFLTFAGILYLTAGGDVGQVERAKAALRAAGIGYGIAVLAPVLVEVFRQIVGA